MIEDTLYRNILRPLLFTLSERDAELAHEWALTTLQKVGESDFLTRMVRKRFSAVDPKLGVNLWGLNFPNPVGLAAGFDKNAVALPALAALGFGFIEVGTVTLDSQTGNPRPRMFRLPKDEALINRMGFNNDGGAAMVLRLAALKKLPIPIGISLGKSKRTPLENAVNEYVDLLSMLYLYGDYFVVNISSPNTPGLRKLHDKDHLASLSRALVAVLETRKTNARRKPILVKLSPDLSTKSKVKEVLEIAEENGIDGFIVANTTTKRGRLLSTLHTNETGGLSGRPLLYKTLKLTEFIRRRSALPVISVGGLSDPRDALSMFDAGASLVQVYTGLVYNGPGFAKNICKVLSDAHL